MLKVCDLEAVWEKLGVVFLAVLHDVTVPLGSLGDDTVAATPAERAREQSGDEPD